jgi:GntR family transcriptional repressor for pyruvate dehydrogenase complex/GntR family transcriptional activator of glc operon
MAISRDISYQLEQFILDGGLVPGQKIPSERQLAARLNVSRSVVREALHKLQGRGVIDTRHGQGSFVASIVPGSRDSAEENNVLMHLFEGHARNIYDLLEVREQLEGQAAFLAAQRATNMDKYRITKAFHALKDTNPLNNALPDHGFHLAIMEASHNPVLVHILSNLKSMMLATVQASVANLNPQETMRKKIVRQHKQLYSAIMSEKPAAAQRVAAAHVRFVSETMKEMENEGSKVIRVSVPPTPTAQCSSLIQ